MPSIIPDYEYDIFISYRHNDNKSGWVTDFVKNLEKELASTVKSPLSVYFDSNPYDGLLETHSVEKSLENKLRCVIFIPIISQTYCDVNCYAWRHEFCVYNQFSKEDPHGRDVMLSNGNVASRILPVKVHDLDYEDNALLEKELGTVLRAVDFIYKQPGVNRPLEPTDLKNDNQNKTAYRNQINKLANAVKEIIYGILRPSDHVVVKPEQPFSVEKTDPRPSIAVLPFSNISNDPEQEYFSEGIMENIIIELAANKKVRVISRTSMMRYKKTTKSAPEIAGELEVNYILEGGIQVRGNKVRINVQLIEGELDELVWSRVFIESMDDIFEIQSSVAEVVARELHASISPQEKATTDEIPTNNMEAYNLYLKGRHAFNQWGVAGYRTATDYFEEAIVLDPDFKLAYSSLASSYSARMSWNGDLSPQEAEININKYLNEAWKRGPSENDYLTKAYLEFFIHKDFLHAEGLLIKALELSANNAGIMYAYSYVLSMMGRFDEALQWVEKAKTIDPLTVAYFNFQAVCLFLSGQCKEAINIIKEGLKLYPTVLRFYDYLAKVYLILEQWGDAKKSAESGMKISGARPPSMVSYAAIAYTRLGEEDTSKALLDELIRRSADKEKGVNISIVYIYNALDDMDAAKEWLKRARETNDIGLIWYDVDPLLTIVRQSLKEEKDKGPDFEEAEKLVLELLEKDMPDLPYHNINHIKDVLSSALSIAEGESLTDEEVKLLRLAALLHDIGFIKSSNDHEAHGVEMSKNILPKLGFTNEQIEVIANMILATRLPQTPSTLLERILCDADLDYLGRDDFYETGGKLFEELKQQGTVESEREWNLVQKTFLQSHSYHTKYGKQNREKEKQGRLQEIMEKLKKR